MILPCILWTNRCKCAHIWDGEGRVESASKKKKNKQTNKNKTFRIMKHSCCCVKGSAILWFSFTHWSSHAYFDMKTVFSKEPLNHVVCMQFMKHFFRVIKCFHTSYLATSIKTFLHQAQCKNMPWSKGQSLAHKYVLLSKEQSSKQCEIFILRAKSHIICPCPTE